MINKEKRSERMNLSLKPTGYKKVCLMAKMANMKPIEYATQAVLGKKIFSAKFEFIINLLLQDYRKQVGFCKLLLRDCDITEEVERIANDTIHDFIKKIEELEKMRREEDVYRHNNQEN